eukprot:scaffold2940_cov21-Tisochrysis_lutea.AAC.1
MEAPLTRLAYLAIRSAPVQRVLHLHGFEVQRVLVGPLLVLLLKGGRPARLLTRDSKDRDPYLTLVRCHQLAGQNAPMLMLPSHGLGVVSKDRYHYAR